MVYSNSVNDGNLKNMLQLKHLRSLSLGSERITDKGVKQLAAYAGLEELYLFDSKISDEGLLALASVKNLKVLGLSTLGTARPNVSEKAVLAFRKALPACVLYGENGPE
jgi:Leucine-rich repeat (LRR) protein